MKPELQSPRSSSRFRRPTNPTSIPPTPPANIPSFTIMLEPAHPPFDHNRTSRLVSHVTQEGAEAVDGTPNAQSVGGGKAEAAPRAKRKKNHQDDEQMRMRIADLEPDEQHIMKDYAGNTPASRLETLNRLEQHRREYNAPPMTSVGNLGPKKGKTLVEWICGICQERKNTFQKIAGHVTSHHWKLKVWSCLRSSCGRKYCSLNELTRHTKETHRRNRQASINTDHPDQVSSPDPDIPVFTAPLTGYSTTATNPGVPVAPPAPHPYSAISYSPDAQLMHASTTHLAAHRQSTEVSRSALALRHTRASTKPPPTGPYPSRKPILVRPPPTTIPRNGIWRLQGPVQAPPQRSPPSDYYAGPPTPTQYTTSPPAIQGEVRDMRGSPHANVAQAVTRSPPPSIPRTGSGTAFDVYGGPHSDVASIPYYGYATFGDDLYELDIPYSGHTSVAASHTHFQPPTRTNQVTGGFRVPRFLDAFRCDDESAGPSKGSSSKDLEQFGTMPAELDLQSYNNNQYFDSHHYPPPPHGTINQSGTDWNGGEVAGHYVEGYYEMEKYMKNGSDVDQVSRRSLSWYCRQV